MTAPPPPSLLRVQTLPGELAASSRRIAAIDVGSNSIHMVIADPEPGGGFVVVDREKEMVRLGRSALSSGGRLSKKAFADGLEALARMTTLARLRGVAHTVAVATSAVREAGNGKEFLEAVRSHTGLAVRRLSGKDEGRFIYRAVREAVDLGAGTAVVADIGGGSTEWIVTEGGDLASVDSLPLGSLRCAARLRGDPVKTKSLHKLRKHIDGELSALPSTGKVETLIATSGTAGCCADLARHFAGRPPSEGSSGLRELRIKDLDRVIARLRAMPRREIALLPAVGAPRSESILAGAMILRRLAAKAGSDRLLVSDRALREGLVLDVVGRPVEELPPPGEIRSGQIDKLARRCPAVYDHHQATARLAVRLFDLTLSVHGLGPQEREWLEYAAMLHDLGYLVAYRRHHKHSFYLINSASLDAFDPREIEVIAHVARYHRRAMPKRDHPTFAALKPWQRRCVRKLAAILRIADALDRSHAQRVEEIFSSIGRRKVTIEVISPWDVSLELTTADERCRMFRRVFRRKVAFRQGLEPVTGGAPSPRSGMR
ncbi:MAG: Ppx/GppA phosphatase family protein [Acidobacteriota bacterium]